jgi:hypothetical protein
MATKIIFGANPDVQKRTYTQRVDPVHATRMGREKLQQCIRARNSIPENATFGSVSDDTVPFYWSWTWTWWEVELP